MSGFFRVYDALVSALSAVAAAIVVFVTFGVSADIILRYLAGAPISWMFELTEYAMFWIPCLGMAWLARERGHIAIDIVTARFSPAIRHRVERVMTVAAAMTTGMVFFWSCKVVATSFSRGTLLENTLQVPEALVLSVIPIGFGLTTIEFLRQAVMGPAPQRSRDPMADLY